MSNPEKKPRSEGWSKGKTFGVWFLQVTACLVFLFAGSAKLVGVQETVVLFEEIGFGQWFRYLTGALEVIGAILIVPPNTAALGSVLLGLVMVGAILSHLFLIGGTPIPAIMVLGLVMLVGHYRRPPLDQTAERSGLWETSLERHG